ncbi:MAG: flagellar motor protein MotB [Succinivibrionaceae bacterium]
MARKPKIPEHENHERWMVSYADFMTLLFAVFVVLYGFAMASSTKSSNMAEALAESFQKMGLISTNSAALIQSNMALLNPLNDNAVSITSSLTNPQLIHGEINGGGGFLDFGNPPSSKSTENSVKKSQRSNQKSDGSTGTDVVDAMAESEGENQMGSPLDSMYLDISEALEELQKEGSITIHKEDSWLTIEINDSLVFAPYSASILNQSKPILAKISEIIYPITNYVRIRGYTDNSVIKNEIYESNWELSSARAISIVKYFIKDEIDPRRLAIEAYAQYSPFVSNSTAKGREKNRCVSIAISKYAMVEKPLKVIPDNEILVNELNDTSGKNVFDPEIDEDEELKMMRLPDGKVKIMKK